MAENEEKVVATEEKTTEEKTTEKKVEVNLTPTTGTYLRYIGAIMSDILSIYGLYQTFDPILATVLSILVTAAIAIAAWKNNSITKGACAADAMKDILKDKNNISEITKMWNEIQRVAADIYIAIKEAAKQ